MCSSISEGHLNAACTKVNSWSWNPDSFSGFSISLICTWVCLKDQEPLLTDLSTLSPHLTHHHALPTSLQKFLGSFYSPHLHYHHLIQPTGASYLDSYGNFLSGLVAHSVPPIIFFPSHSSHSNLKKKKKKEADPIILCHYLFEMIQWLSIVFGKKAKFLAWLHCGSQGPAWSHSVAIFFLLSIIHLTSFFSFLKMLPQIPVPLHILYFIFNVETYSQCLNSHIMSHFKGGNCCVPHIPLSV